jgi:hypothetical protein
MCPLPIGRCSTTLRGPAARVISGGYKAQGFINASRRHMIRSVGPKMAKKIKLACVDRRNVFLDQLFTLITNPVLKVLGHK